MRKFMIVLTFAMLLMVGCQDIKPVTQAEASVAGKVLQDDKATAAQRAEAGKALERWQQQQRQK